MRSNVVNISNESRSRVHQPLVGGSIIYTLLLGLIEFDSSLILSDMQFCFWFYRVILCETLFLREQSIHSVLNSPDINVHFIFVS